MEGMSERQYAAHVGLSRGAIQKAKDTGRLVQHADGSIDAIASDARRAAMTDPAKQRSAKAAASPLAARLKPVPDAALSVVGETLREHGLVAPVTNGGTTYPQARTVNEVLKAQERKLTLKFFSNRSSALAPCPPSRQIDVQRGKGDQSSVYRIVASRAA